MGPLWGDSNLCFCAARQCWSALRAERHGRSLRIEVGGERDLRRGVLSVSGGENFNGGRCTADDNLRVARNDIAPDNRDGHFLIWRRAFGYRCRSQGGRCRRTESDFYAGTASQ